MFKSKYVFNLIKFVMSVILSVLQEIERDDIETEELQLQIAGSPAHPSRNSISPTLLPQPPKKKKRDLGTITKQNELLNLACKYLSSSGNETITAANDEYLNVAKVWANKLKSLEPEQRILAEKAINDVFLRPN